MTSAFTPRRRSSRPSSSPSASASLAALADAARGTARRRPGPAVVAPERPATGTQAEIAPPPGRRAAARPRRPARASQLAAAYLQRVRETGDPSLYGRADALLRGVIAREPRNAAATVELAGARALAPRLPARRSRSRSARARLEPRGAARALPSMVDALVELGRYDEAERALQRLADRKPNLSVYARVSYLRELRGDLGGAASALALAAAAGGPAPENSAAIEVLRGDLALVRGRPAGARRAYTTALALAPATRRPRPAARGSRAYRRRPARRGGAVAEARRPPAAARVRDRARRGRAGRGPAAGGAPGPRARARRAVAARPRPASTPTPSWRSSRPTTATARAACGWRGARGRRRRACARRTRWAGR